MDLTPITLISLADVAGLAPVMIVLITAIAVLITDLIVPSENAAILPVMGGAGIVIAGVTLLAMGTPGLEAQPAFGGVLLFSNMTFMAHIVILAVMFFLVLVSPNYIKDRPIATGEYYALLLFSTVAMMTLSASAELVAFFLNFELLSFSFYILTAMERHNLRATEAGFKYFLTGSYAAAFMLFGLTMIYGVTGTTFFGEIAAQLETGLTAGPISSPAFLVGGLALMLVGIGFKLTLAPFHMYAPDVYAGAPTPVAGGIATGSKVAGFVAAFTLFRIFAGWTALPIVVPYIVYGLCVLSILVGNVGAVMQPNLKRLLAYSGVAHSGYTLVPIVAMFSNPELAASAERAVIYYVAAYALMTVLAFGVAAALGHEGDGPLERYAGLGRRSPFLAATLSIALLSLAGVPITVGFLGKFYIFTVAVDAQLYLLAVFVVLASIMSAYYYLRVMVVMYMQDSTEAEARPVEVEATSGVALTLAAVGVVIFAIFPGLYLAG